MVKFLSKNIFEKGSTRGRVCSPLLISWFILSLAISVSFAEPVKEINSPTTKALSEEVLQLLQKRYADPSLLTNKKLSRAAVEGILETLGPSAKIIDPKTTPKKPSAPRSSILPTVILDPPMAYLRLERIDDETPKQLEKEIQKCSQEKSLLGIILDLRFTQGAPYSIVPSLASYFLPETKPLFSILREGATQNYPSISSPSITDLPLILLINQETKEAAEVFAAVLQDQKRAILLGRSSTAGMAFETSEIALSNGQILCLATGKIVLAHGGDFFLKGVHPDVQIVLDVKLEKEIYDKPFQPPALKLEPRSSSEAILTGREAPPLFNEEKTGLPKAKKKESDIPPTNNDTTLLCAIDMLKSIQALELKSSSNRFVEEKKE